MFTLFKNLGLCILFLFLLPSLKVNAQESDYIMGRLVDTQNGAAVPFATLIIKNQQKGLISNTDGGFKIPKQYQLTSDTLLISSIGYASRTIPLSKLTADEINLILLSPKVEQLDEVVLVESKNAPQLTARAIVRKAMKKIPENYPFEPFSYIGYYRDYQIKQGEYINLNEAIMEVFDPGFGVDDRKGTQTSMYQYKRNTDFTTDTLASKPYDYLNRSKIMANATIGGQGVNEFTLLRLHDAVRNYNINTYDYVNQLNTDLIRNHRLRLLPETSIDNIPLYRISIAKTQNKYKVSGAIYISKGDLKIYKLEYAVYDIDKPPSTRPEKLGEDPVREVKGKQPGQLLYQILVEYRQMGDIMYPNYISFNNAFEVRLPPKFFPVAASVDRDKKRFELIFNNPLENKDALKKNNYTLWYQELLLNIERTEVKDNTVYLYPKNVDFVFDRDRIASRRMQSDKEVAIQARNIRDVYGNLVYEQESENYNQFREFFVQEVNPSSARPSDSVFLKKNLPISAYQPIGKPENLGDYWMNTPLKN